MKKAYKSHVSFSFLSAVMIIAIIITFPSVRNLYSATKDTYRIIENKFRIFNQIIQYVNEYYYWDESNVISNVCGHCTELHIKGTPAINNIQTIVMGVINNSDERVYGKVLVNELRMTGVKKRKGRSYSVSSSLSFADLMTISGNYNKKDSDFHKLQQRLGTGNSDESYSATLKLHPNIVLPTRWGIKTPITLGYTNSVATPKYHPGSDILTASETVSYTHLTLPTNREQ